jgi:hypothetical protein
LGSRGTVPLILKFGTRWTGVVSFTPLRLYRLGKSLLYPGPKGGLEALQKKTISCLGQGSSHSSSVVFPVVGSLYRLRYLSSAACINSSSNSSSSDAGSASSNRHRVGSSPGNYEQCLLGVSAARKLTRVFVSTVMHGVQYKPLAAFQLQPPEQQLLTSGHCVIPYKN